MSQLLAIFISSIDSMELREADKSSEKAEI